MSVQNRREIRAGEQLKAFLLSYSAAGLTRELAAFKLAGGRVVVPRRPASPDWPRWLSRRDAAAYTGLSIGTLAARGPRPFKVGGRILYDRRELDRWLERQAGAVAPAAGKAWLEALKNAN